MSIINQYKFNTLEELQHNYPIGSIFSKRTEHYINIHTYYNKNDLKAFENYYDKVEILDNTTCITYKTLINARIVNGYIYDGEYWCPAYIGHDGWCEYDKSDIFEEQEIIYDNARKYNN